MVEGGRSESLKGPCAPAEVMNEVVDDIKFGSVGVVDHRDEDKQKGLEKLMEKDPPGFSTRRIRNKM